MHAPATVFTSRTGADSRSVTPRLTGAAVGNTPLPWRRIVLWFLASRCLIVATAAVALRYFAKGAWFETPRSVLHWFIRWDAGWFRDVAENGYAFHADRMSNVNFLPLYPVLVRALSWAMPIEAAGYLVTHACCLGAALVLWRVTERIRGNGDEADGAVLFFLFGPVSVFFTTMYSEATFLLCALLSMLAAQRERWLLAGVAGAGAALTRSVGVLLVVPLAVAFLQSHAAANDWRRLKTWGQFACCGLPAAGGFAFTLYLGWRFAEPRAYFISHHHAGHVRSFVWQLFDSYHFATLPPFYQIWFGAAVLGGLLPLLGAALLRQPLAYTLFALALCLLYFSVKSLEGMPRFLSIVFPFYGVLGVVWARARPFGWTLLGASAALGAMSTTLFVNGYWFT